MLQHPVIEHERDAVRRIVDERERRDAARRDTEHLVADARGCRTRSAVRRACRPDLQVDPAFLERDDEPEPALPILQEQALAMAARQAAAQGRRLGDRKDRRMRVGPVRYAKGVEPGEQLIGGIREFVEDGMAERCDASLA